MSFEKIISFKKFVLNEDNRILKSSANDIAEELESLKKIASTGIMELSDDLEAVFSTIQNILHGKWLKQQQQFLVPLQTVAYNLKLLIDGEEEAKEQNPISILQSCVKTINDEIISKISGPINKLGVSKEEEPVSEKLPSGVVNAKADGEINPPSSGFDKSSLPPLGQPPER